MIKTGVVGVVESVQRHTTIRLDSPKSASLTWPLESSRMFSGLRSRYTMSQLWICGGTKEMIEPVYSILPACRLFGAERERGRARGCGGGVHVHVHRWWCMAVVHGGGGWLVGLTSCSARQTCAATSLASRSLTWFVEQRHCL